MTKAQLTVWINWDPDGTGIGADLPGPNVMQFDIEVTDPNEPVTITIDHDKVSMNTPHEPKLVTLPEEAPVTSTHRPTNVRMPHALDALAVGTRVRFDSGQHRYEKQANGTWLQVGNLDGIHNVSATELSDKIAEVTQGGWAQVQQ